MRLARVSTPDSAASFFGAATFLAGFAAAAAAAGFAATFLAGADLGAAFLAGAVRFAVVFLRAAMGSCLPLFPEFREIVMGLLAARSRAGVRVRGASTARAPRVRSLAAW